MTDFTLQLAAGEERAIVAPGKYFRVIKASYETSIAVNDGILQSRPFGVAEFVPGGFGRLRIYSARAQEVVVSVTDGRVDDSRLGQLVPIEVTSGELVSSVFDMLITGALVTLVTPAQNTNGIRVFGATIANNGTNAARIMYKTSDPVSAIDNTAGTIHFTMGGTQLETVVGFPIVIPKGNGLYYMTSVSLTYYGVEYEIL